MKGFQITNSLRSISTSCICKPLLALFLLFILLIQQFSAYASFPDLSNPDEFDSYQVNRSSSKAFFTYYISSTSESKPIQYEAIVEFEEDDTSNGNEELFLHGFFRGSNHEFVIASNLKTRLLTLADSINQQAKISLFVLNHSWKSQLI